jgi:hypothetical protein
VAPRLVQRLRKIVDFKTDVPRELKRQLRELEQGFADALAGFADGITALFTGLDGVNVIGNTIRSSRDVKIYTAGGNNLSGAAKADILRFELTAHATVTGFVAPGLNDTHRKLVVNASAYTLTLGHNATSAVTSRLFSPHLVDYELRPSECVWIDYDRTDQRWRVAQQSQPFHIIRTAADLPAAVGGVRSLPAGAYQWPVLVDIGTDQLDILANAVCFSIGPGGVTSNRSGAAVRCRNSVNSLGFSCSNTGSGPALEPFTLDTQYFYHWHVIGDIAVGTPVMRWLGGAFTEMLIPNGVGSVVVELAGSGAVGRVTIIDLHQTGGATQALLTVGSGIRVTSGISLTDCRSDSNALISLPSTLNDSGAAAHVSLRGCHSTAANTVSVSVVPAGGLTVEDCTLHASSGYSGFTATTAKVIARENRDASGNLLPETPNGHIVKNNAGTDQTQRHYLKAGTGLEATDDGTNTVLSVSSSITDTLTFADDATYGYELSAQLPVTSLPSSCIAAVRIACAWGATAASGGAVADIDRDGSGWVYLQVTKNSGTLVQVEYTYDRLGTPVPEYHVVHEDLFDDGNNPSTAGTFYVQITSGQIEVFVRIPGTGAHSGATYEGTATMFIDSVHTRTALS